MYVEGIVTEVKDYYAKIVIPEYGDLQTEWLVIPQLFTVNNKAGYKPEIGSLVSAVLSEDMKAGCIIGAIYNDMDAQPEYDGEFLNFSDGVKLNHKPGTNTFDITAETININGNIVCTGDISDKNGTVQSIRDWANAHSHTNGNNGGNTGTPTTSV